jgi:hypothetical protein
MLVMKIEFDDQESRDEVFRSMVESSASNGASMRGRRCRAAHQA